MTDTFARASWRNFLGQAPDWYKALIVACLVANPLVLAAFGPVAAGWTMLFEFIVTLMMALRCYPLQPGGLLALDLLPPVKRAVMRQNLGFAGGTPKVARK